MCVVIDLDVVCLICLQPSKDMLPIFTTDGDDAELQIAQKISILSELKTDQSNRTLPRKICDKCLQDLKAAWRFRKNCQAAVTIFQTIVKLGDAQPPNSQDKGLPEQQIKVPHGLQLKRITIDNQEEIGKANRPIDLDKATVKEDCVINNEKAGPSTYDNMEANNYEENQDTDTPEFQTVDEADESGEHNEMFGDDESNYIEYYIADDGTDESTTTIYQKIYTKMNADEKYTKVKPLNVDVEKQHRNIQRYTIESSAIPSSNDRPRRQNLFRKDIDKSTNVVQKKTKGIIVIDSTNSSEMATKSEVRQVKTRKRKSLSPDVKTPKICDLCGNSYRFQHALNAHMRRHNNDKPFPCECCDKAFVSNVELRRHMRVHTGQKPYACQYCERRFSDFGSRIKHERTHTGERPYHCVTCGKSFAYPHVLSVHVLTHTGEKRFRCEYCTKGFTKKAYLISHVNQIHSGPKNFQVVIDDTMDNSQYHGKSENIEESVYTAEISTETIDEVEECDDDSYQNSEEIIITHSMREPKVEVSDDAEPQEVEEKSDELLLRLR